MFKVSCRSIRDLIAAKHEKIANNIILIIAKKAKNMANGTMDAFDKLNLAIESTPKDIEDLSAIRDQMQSAPQEMQKLDA